MDDYLDPINSVGMPELTDSGIALEFLLSTKTGRSKSFNCIDRNSNTYT